MSKPSGELHNSREGVKPTEWKWKRWDVRADGKVFWQYHEGVERWVTWESAMKNRANLNKAAKKQREANPEKHNRLNQKWREKNRERHRANARAWGKLNRERCNENRRKNRAKKRKTDPYYALLTRCRSRTTKAFQEAGYTKKSKTREMLGADLGTVAFHIECQFLDGMGWHNRDEWHIDHIVPLSHAKNEDELAKLCHYTNLQPLWAKDNLRKGAIHKRNRLGQFVKLNLCAKD